MNLFRFFALAAGLFTLTACGGPDLKVKDVGIAWTGGWHNVDARIVNEGYEKVEGFVEVDLVALDAQGAELARQRCVVHGIDEREERRCAREFSSLMKGTADPAQVASIKVIVDPRGKISEENEGNNDTTEPVDAFAKR